MLVYHSTDMDVGSGRLATMIENYELNSSVGDVEASFASLVESTPKENDVQAPMSHQHCSLKRILNSYRWKPQGNIHGSRNHICLYAFWISWYPISYMRFCKPWEISVQVETKT